MRHLKPADYTRMPWANGRGQTVELLRVDQGGALLWRLSMAAVVEDGPFSLFPGVARNLTVISGPGFWLTGDGVTLHCAPLVPVAFTGDVLVNATGVTAPSDDFNVMTAWHLPRPEVRVLHGATDLPAGGTLCLFALGLCQVNGQMIGVHDLIITDTAAHISGAGPLIAVRLAVPDWHNPHSP